MSSRVWRWGRGVVSGGTGGLAVGLVLIAFYGFGTFRNEVNLSASAAHGNETFAIASGSFDEQNDAVFFLDFATGRLTGVLLHPKHGKAALTFKTDVTKDLPPEQGKRPSYVMTTARLTPQPATADGKRMGHCVVYVADCNSGKVAIYSYASQAFFGKPPVIPLVLTELVDTREVK